MGAGLRGGQQAGVLLVSDTEGRGKRSSMGGGDWAGSGARLQGGVLRGGDSSGALGLRARAERS